MTEDDPTFDLSKKKKKKKKTAFDPDAGEEKPEVGIVGDHVFGQVPRVHGLGPKGGARLVMV